MKNILVKCSNRLEKLMILSILYSFGFKYDDYPTYKELLNDSVWDDDYYPDVLADINDLTIDICNTNYDSDSDTVITASEVERLIGLLSDMPVVFELTADYNAVVSSTEIIVGCQTISFEVFDKLVKVVGDKRNKK